ncbi:MAG: precorrin-6y C5,15-methyltransferase (decarboxylating), CbiE subunit [Pelosinus sp.]|jgi:cobalt-precorrin-7 (C5)-methyltransferase|nr:precorrin-6y C5,15-methyltransferase (decarboxylating), CbiE subunit [Pelosinus sp.]
MEHKIIVVGIGPGSPDYMLPVASRMIAQAKVIVGSQRALTTFAPSHATSKVIDNDLTGVLDFITKALMDNDVVVMVSGDPGFYSFLATLRTRFSSEYITVIPGISSMQLAFARISEIWQNAVLISMHGRQAKDTDLNYCPDKKLGILTDYEQNPLYIAKVLRKHGWPSNANVWLCANLSYENERIKQLTLGEINDVDGFTHCVMVVTT